jgi:signal transduction histidine kinase
MMHGVLVWSPAGQRFRSTWLHMFWSVDGSALMTNAVVVLPASSGQMLKPPRAGSVVLGIVMARAQCHAHLVIDMVAPPAEALRFPARPRRLAPLPALAWWAVVVLAVGLTAVRVWYRLEVRADSALIVVATITGFVIVVVSGLAAWAGRPDSRIGILLVAWGMINITGGVYDHENGFLLLWSSLNPPLIGVVFARALLTYPSGRTRTRVERVFVMVIYASVSLWMLYALVSEPWWISNCTQETCPPNPVLIRPVVAAAWVLWWSQRAAMVGLGLWFAVLMLSRLRRITPAERRIVMPVAVAAAVPFSAFLLPPILDASMLGPGWWWWVAWWINRVGMFTVPVAMAVGLLTSRLARASVADLLVRLRSVPGDVLRPELAALLRDPTVEIAVPAGDGYTDVGGRSVVVDDATDRRERTDLGDGALLLHDPAAKANDAALFDAAVAAVRLALENSRLTAQVQAQLAEVNRSRSRLVTAAYEERRRLERDLHDGAQQSLLGVGMSLQMARREVPEEGPVARLLDEATAQLQDSLAELRALARGLKPAMLAERGLEAALAELARRMPIPVDLNVQRTPRPAAEVELTAYYVVAEALQNVAKHSRATSASVVCRNEGRRLHLVVADDGVGGADPRAGTGLRGLADRVAAMNGHMSVESPPDCGTRIVVDLPYVVDLIGTPGGAR